MHHHRSEHWVVVSGQARVHYGTETHDIKVNDPPIMVKMLSML